MKEFDFRPYAVSILVSIVGFFIGRNVGDDHDAARAAEAKIVADAEKHMDRTDVEIAAMRNEFNRFYLEFKAYVANNTARDEVRDEKIQKMIELINGQGSRYRRLIYFPTVVAVADSLPDRADTVKVNFLVRR